MLRITHFSLVSVVGDQIVLSRSPFSFFSWESFSEKNLSPSRKCAKVFEQIQQTVVIGHFNLGPKSQSSPSAHAKCQANNMVDRSSRQIEQISRLGACEGNFGPPRNAAAALS